MRLEYEIEIVFRDGKRVEAQISGNDWDRIPRAHRKTHREAAQPAARTAVAVSRLLPRRPPPGQTEAAGSMPGDSPVHGTTVAPPASRVRAAIKKHRVRSRRIPAERRSPDVPTPAVLELEHIAADGHPAPQLAHSWEDRMRRSPPRARRGRYVRGTARGPRTGGVVRRLKWGRFTIILVRPERKWASTMVSTSRISVQRREVRESAGSDTVFRREELNCPDRVGHRQGAIDGNRHGKLADQFYGARIVIAYNHRFSDSTSDVAA